MKHALIVTALFFHTCVWAQVCPILSVGNDITVCPGNVQLNASSNFNLYEWSPSTGLSNPNIQNPIATVTGSITYYLKATKLIFNSPNLVINGDFSSGNTGFINGMTHSPASAPCNYNVSPDFFGDNSPTIVDHTSSSDDLFMSINGCITAPTVLWEQTIPVIDAEHYYKFSFWATRAAVHQPGFEIHFIGNVTGDFNAGTGAGVPDTTGIWTWDEYVLLLWGSGPNTSVTIRIINASIDDLGNDFGMDDFSLHGACTDFDTIQITAANFTTTVTKTDVLCHGDNNGTATVNPSGGITPFTYYWMPSGQTTQTAINLSPGPHMVTVQDSVGCLETGQVNILDPPEVPPPVTNDVILCLDQTPEPLQATGQNILWYSSATDPSGSIAAPMPGTGATDTLIFYATQTINNCESEKVALQVAIIDQPFFELSVPQKQCLYGFELGPSNDYWQYTWMDLETTSPRSITVPGNYILSAANQCGNFADSVLIDFEDCECHLYLPNAFTPNNDGLNDVLIPIMDCAVKNYKFRIYNRWGQMIFETNDPNAGWNGKQAGQSAPEDVFIVQLIYQGRALAGNFEEKLLVQKVVLIR